MAGMVYEWKKGYHNRGVDPNVAGKEITRLHRLHGGDVTPETVVAAASDEESPIHELFTWDDDQAARKHREAEARSLLGAIKITVLGDHDEPIKTRAFVKVRKQDSEGRGHNVYTTVTAAFKDPDLRDQIIAQALRELEYFTNKYKGYSALAGVITHVERAVRAGKKKTAKKKKSKRRSRAPSR